MTATTKKKSSSKKKTLINIKDVWKTYTMGETKVHALRGLNLTVNKGEFLAVMGPSGSGKSTAMNMIGVLDRPTTGMIRLEGKDINKFSESGLAQIRGQKIGFIFQKFNLINTLTAKENVMLPLMFQRTSEEKRQQKAEELLKLVELDDRMNHKPSELSGGQQQRVAIARALAVDPEVILADEPTGNLDSSTGDTVMDFLKKLHDKEGKTIIMVTHDEEVAKFADRVEHLRDGQIVKTTNKNNKH
ncbi:MAG: ABC transporter ATP-binding protein [Nanobdellota archaeon]